MSVVNQKKWTCDLCSVSMLDDKLPGGWLELEYRRNEVVVERDHRHVCAPCRLRIGEAHAARCVSGQVSAPWRAAIPLMRGIIRQILDCLPNQRDWLDPDLEKQMKDVVGGTG